MIAKNFTKGFSTLELMIAFALISIVLVGAVGGNFIAQYWSLTSVTANEGLYRAKTKLEDLRADIKSDFYGTVSSPRTKDTTDPVCNDGGLCYYITTNVTDISSCSKFVNANVDWQVQSYPQTSTSLSTNLTNTPEIIARGGDCILNTPAGNWKSNTPQSVGATPTGVTRFTGIDVLHKYIFVTANTTPSFLVYKIPTAVGVAPALVGSYDLKSGGSTPVSLTLNAVDVEEDLSTGRTYAFVAVNSTINQLAVIDVTDPSNPVFKAQADLSESVDPNGSFPQGFRLYIYDSRLYFTVRETAGTEFHVFDITSPEVPAEIGSGYKLGRTVEDIVVRKQKVAGVTKTIAYLATDVLSKELTVLDVTNPTSISEIADYNTPGSADGASVYLNGNKLYFGTMSSGSTELYEFDITTPSSPTLLGSVDVGSTDVESVKVSGDYAFVSTKNELQVWSSDYTTWSSGKLKTFSMSNITPNGFDIDGDWLYLVSNSAGGDKIQVLYTTP